MPKSPQPQPYSAPSTVVTFSGLCRVLPVCDILGSQVCSTPTKYELLLLLLSRFSSVRLCAAAHPGSSSLGFSRQEHWSGLPFPSPMREGEVAQSCPTLSDPMDCSLPGSSVHGIFQTRVLEWVAIAFSDKYETLSLIPLVNTWSFSELERANGAIRLPFVGSRHAQVMNNFRVHLPLSWPNHSFLKVQQFSPTNLA